MLLWRHDLALKSSIQTFTCLNFRACNSHLQQSAGLTEGVLSRICHRRNEYPRISRDPVEVQTIWSKPLDVLLRPGEDKGASTHSMNALTRMSSLKEYTA